VSTEQENQILTLLTSINLKVDRVESALAAVTDAFPKNTVNKPDFDGHRTFHERKIDDAKLMQSYKVDTTKKILGAVGLFLLMLLGSGLMSYIKEVVARGVGQ